MTWSRDDGNGFSTAGSRGGGAPIPLRPHREDRAGWRRFRDLARPSDNGCGCREVRGTVLPARGTRPAPSGPCRATAERRRRGSRPRRARPVPSRVAGGGSGRRHLDPVAGDDRPGACSSSTRLSAGPGSRRAPCRAWPDGSRCQAASIRPRMVLLSRSTAITTNRISRMIVSARSKRRSSNAVESSTPMPPAPTRPSTTAPRTDFSRE